MQINSKGLGLIVALGVIMLIISLVLLAVNFTLSNFALFNYTVNSIKAFTFSEAGIQRAMYNIKKGEPPNNEFWNFSDQTIHITINRIGTSDDYNVLSRGLYNNITKTIKAQVALDTSITPNRVNLSEWEQKD